MIKQFFLDVGLTALEACLGSFKLARSISRAELIFGRPGPCLGLAFGVEVGDTGLIGSKLS